MWIYYFVSYDRLNQLLGQIDPRIIIEESITSTKQQKEKSRFAISISKLSSIFSFGAESSYDFEEQKGISSRKRIRFSKEQVIIQTVNEFLYNSDNVTTILQNSTFEVNTKFKKIIRFEGYFKPEIPGDKFKDRLYFYETNKSIQWQGLCGNTNISFDASKNNTISDTPILPALRDSSYSYLLKGYGTFNGWGKFALNLLPIFIGTEL